MYTYKNHKSSQNFNCILFIDQKKKKNNNNDNFLPTKNVGMTHSLIEFTKIGISIK